MIVDGTPEWTFELAPADRDNFRFKAGQNLDITILDLVGPADDKGRTRTFSISSSPNRKGEFTVTTRLSTSSFKETVMQFAPGIEVEITNPGGQFNLPKSAENPLVFIAGGIGITPFISILRYATEEKLPHKIWLIYSNRSEDSAAYLSDLRDLARANSNFTLIENYGPLTAELVKEKTTGLVNPTYYIAGPGGMVGMAHKLLSDSGVKDDDILIEEFAGY